MHVLFLLAVFMVCLAILCYGAEGMLHGAVSIATRLGISQLASARVIDLYLV